MEYKKFAYALFFRLLITVILCLFLAYSYTTMHSRITFAIGGGIIFMVMHIYLFVIRRYKEISYFLESVKYRDFSRRFSEVAVPDDIKYLHKGFNTTIETINDINTEKETQYLYLQTILEIVNTGIIAYNVEDGQVLWLNESFKKILDIPTIRNINFIEKRKLDVFQTIFSDFNKNGDTITLSVKNETLKYWRTSSKFKVDHYTYRLITLQDIDFTLNENESDAWKKLLSVMTHEIMNSVAPITSLAQTLHGHIKEVKDRGSRENLDLEDLELGIESIKKRSEGLMKFAKTYRSLNKITSLNKEKIEVRQLFDNIINLLKPSMASKDIKFYNDIDPVNMKVEIDLYLIEQVLINLILNAVEACEKVLEPKITLSAKKTLEGQNIIMVEDNGKGISQEIQDKIFIPFFTTKKKGNGIGLSLSKQIMTLHHGKIQIKSLENKGTKVSLIFN